MSDPELINEISAIANVQNRYARALDDQDWEKLRDCFVEDCVIDFDGSGHWTTRATFLEWATHFHEPSTASMHQTSSHQAVVTGDKATASCYVHAIVTGHPSFAAAHVFGRYDDELERIDSDWRITHRRYTSLRMETQAQ